MKLIAVLLALVFANNSFCADANSAKAYMEAVNKFGSRLNEATEGKNLVQQITIMNGLLLEYSDNNAAVDLLYQQTATNYSFSGQHLKALAAFDKHYFSSEGLIDEVKLLKARNALDTILEISADRQIVMINEAHHVAQHRVLTYNLLESLWKQGFRYFAAEALSENAADMLGSGYVSMKTGYYTQEPIFSNLVLYARNLGFQIISYDYSSGEPGDTKTREQGAARHIQEKIFDRDPKAKVVIHVGYSHIDETAWLAHYLKENPGLDPLTIDQTNIAEKSEPQYESDTYKWIVDNWKLATPMILVDENNSTWSVDKKKYDMTVIWPRTRYEFGRPTWASLGRDHLPVDNQWCKQSFPCMVEVFRMNGVDEVPTDRTVINSASENSAIFLSKGNNIVVVTGADGQQLFKQTITH